MSVSEDDHLKRILQCSTVWALKAMAQKIFYSLWESVHIALLSAIRWLFLEFLFEIRSLSIWNLWLSDSRHTADDVSQKKNKKNKKNFLCSSKVILAKPNIYSSSSVVFPLCSGEKLDLKPTPSSCQACERSRHTHKHTHANKQPCWTLPEATVTDLQWPLLEHR